MGVGYWRTEVPRADAIAMIATTILWGILLLASAWASTRFELEWLRSVMTALGPLSFPAAWLLGLPVIRRVVNRHIQKA